MKLRGGMLVAWAGVACAAGLGLALGLGGCAVEPSPERDQIVADALPAAVIPGVWGEAARRGSVPDGWVTSLNDRGLEAVVGEALKNNLDLRAAQARLDQAGAAAAAAGASLKPVVDATGGGVAQGGASDNRVTSRGVGLNMSWELDVWGRVRSQEAAATELYEGAELDFEFARQSIAAAAAKAYFLATETLQQQSLAAADVEAGEEMSRVIGLRRTAGKATEQDARLAQAELSASKNRLAAAENAHDQAVRALETLLGRYPSNELSTGATLPEMPGDVPAGIPSEVLERRPDVAAAERRVRGAFQNVQAKELAKLPRIALTSGIGVNSDLTDLTSRGGGFFNVGANFFAPVFDGGARDAEVRIATAEQEQALAAYGQTALKAFLDVENALGGEATLAEREALIAAAVRDAEEALRLRTLEADAGKADTLSVLQLQRQVFTGRSALVALRTARRSQRVDLHMALGGDFE